MRAVHFVLDQERADRLREQWLRAKRTTPLDLVDTPDRRLTRAAAERVASEASDPGTYVTVVLPRRSYSPLLGRLLHDRTADKIARVVSRIPRAAATIIPFDVEDRVEVLHEREAGRPLKPPAPEPAVQAHEHPAVPAGVTPIAEATGAGQATVAGRVRSVEIRPVKGSCVLSFKVTDASGELTALFYGRTHIAGLEPGSKVLLHGSARANDHGPVMINPAYELLP
jgi:hypothetical protein